MRLFRPLLLLTACVLIISAAAHAQDQLKVIEWADHREITGRIDETWLRHIETVELEAILINGKIVTIGETFPAGIDWVNELTFRVKNVSADDIAFVQITLTLPELKHSPQIPYLAPCGNKANQPCLRSGEQADLKIHSRKLL